MNMTRKEFLKEFGSLAVLASCGALLANEGCTTVKTINTVHVFDKCVEVDKVIKTASAFAMSEPI